MTHKFLVTLLTAFLSSALVGCVSKSKHDELLQRHESTMKNLNETTEELQNARTTVSEQGILINDLTNKLGATSSDKKRLESSVEEMKEALAELSKRRRAAEERIADYAELVKKFKSFVDAGRLNIKIVDGRMVVEMNSDILFPSGSSKTSDTGEETLREVAFLLKDLTGRKFQIEGHTDNVPIRTSNFPSNWELAAARAITVVKTMIGAGMPPERISAASFGPYKPVASNDTAKGRAANRRIEIVLVPDVSQLPGVEELEAYAAEKAP